MDSLIRRPSVVDEIAKQQEPPLALMIAPPADPLDRDKVGNSIWVALVDRFRARLSEKDIRLWDNAPPDWNKSREHIRIMHQFEVFVIRFGFVSFGPNMLCSVEVLNMLYSWRERQPDLLAQVGEALKQNAMVWLGQAKAPWPDDLDEFAYGVIEELKKLMHRMGHEFGSRRGTPSCLRIAGWMKVEIETHPEEFKFLRAELAQLCGWVEQLPIRNPAAAKTLCRAGMRGDSFFYLWYSSLSGHNAKTVRNRTAHLRTHR